MAEAGFFNGLAITSQMKHDLLPFLNSNNLDLYFFSNTLFYLMLLYISCFFFSAI